MTFVYPEVFLLLIVLVVFFMIKKTSKIEQVFAKEVLDKLQIGSSKLFGKTIRFYLLLVVFVLMLVALARPVVLSEKMSKIDVKSFNLVIMLDVSKSMEAKDVFPSRLELAKKAIYKMMDEMSAANIAVIAYTHDAFLVSPFSNDFRSIQFLLSNLDTNSLSSSGSQILSALESSKKVFESTNDTKKVLLLVSDGADGNDLAKIDSYIKANNFVLHVLNVGTKKGTTLQNSDGGLIKDTNENIVVSKRDDSIAKVAHESGGAFLSTTGDLQKLDWLSKEIKSSVDTKEVKLDRLGGAKELFYYPLSVALGLLFFVFNAIRLPFLAVLIFVQVDSNAGAFDFVDIYNAKKSYENKEYKKAANEFSKIDTKSAKYNEANALYKDKKYNEALKKYQSIEGFSNDDEAKRLYNIGNSYANLNKIDEAIKSYESALKIKDDADTKANLELLKKKKQEQQKKENKKENKKDKDKNQDKDKQDKSDKKDKSDKNDKKDEQQNKEQKQDKEQNKDKSDKQKDTEKKDKEKQDKEKQDAQQNNAKQEKEPQEISEAEAKKWDKKMNDKTYKTRPIKLQQGEKNEINW